MVVIRLARAGGHKKPFYHVVVTDRRNSRDGRFIERVGFYNPIAVKNEIYLQVNQERVKHWLSCGAQPSERVERLLKAYEKTGATTKPVKKVKPKKVVATKPKDEQPPAAASTEAES